MELACSTLGGGKLLLCIVPVFIKHWRVAGDTSPTPHKSNLRLTLICGVPIKYIAVGV